MKKKSALYLVIGTILVFSGIYIVLSTYFSVVKNEIVYQATSRNLVPKVDLTPVDTKFGIVIPKIQANSRIIKNVDPFKSNIYQRALTQGVAHANTSSLPGAGGNIFLFSHSSADFLTATRYNSIFYLLSKLEKDDVVKIFYEEKEFKYSVVNKKITESNDTSFMYSRSDQETLTLMTCWPPGTSLKRLVIHAKRLP